MSGRTPRASVREELGRAANNADMICRHLMKIEQIVTVGKRPDMIEDLKPVGEMAATLKEILVNLKESL